MKVTIIGTHGIPASYGGFETFAEHLAKACAASGIEIQVINEKNNPVVPGPDRIKILSSSYNKSDNPLKFYRESLQLASGESDIIISCGVGGAFFYPDATSRNYKIITCIDGLEHLRKKYSPIQKIIIYMLQNFAARRSDILVSDSNEVYGYWIHRFRKNLGKVKAISYGADECLPFESEILTRYGLEKNEYFLVIARLVPENFTDEIIKAFRHYMGKKKLVITGKLEGTAYATELKKLANSNVIFTGAIYDKKVLDTFRQGCFIYLHGHSVGGTNPSLLEAMAAGCACICQDNVFNREVTKGGQVYFHKSTDLAIMLNLFEHKSADIVLLSRKALERVKEKYTWDRVCAAYIDLFHQILKPVNENRTG